MAGRVLCEKCNGSIDHSDAAAQTITPVDEMLSPPKRCKRDADMVASSQTDQVEGLEIKKNYSSSKKIEVRHQIIKDFSFKQIRFY
jgi:hypothetical protein